MRNYRGGSHAFILGRLVETVINNITRSIHELMWFNRKESTQVLQGEVMGLKPISAHEGLIKH